MAKPGMTRFSDAAGPGHVKLLKCWTVTVDALSRVTPMAARPSAITAPTANHLTTLLYFQRAAHQPDGPRNPTQDGNAWAASSRAIHIISTACSVLTKTTAARLQRPLRIVPRLGRPLSARIGIASLMLQSRSGSSGHRLHIVGRRSSCCKSPTLGSFGTQMRIGLQSRLSASSPQFHESAAHPSARTGACCRRKADGSRKLPRVPGKLVISRYWSPQSPVAH